eukprot:5494610-Ditylum_brightwellii.AAC.2
MSLQFGYASLKPWSPVDTTSVVVDLTPSSGIIISPWCFVPTGISPHISIGRWSQLVLVHLPHYTVQQEDLEVATGRATRGSA